ncbi:MAG: EpsI family protein [Candidatus Omnitrophica bacterium]|nr:EpsI family protein [Candidatus Omnitrophota bacterium]MBU4478272.1 EpsI family protein [Candidatus Omnitrophota bacterium]MCG2703340.1 EpsI family protein [Candidatus Omnitrophota bacterium]
MKKIDSLTISIIILLFCAIFIAWIKTAKVQEGNDVEKPQVPGRLGEWIFSRDIPINEEFLNILGTRGAVLAEYGNSEGEKIYLYILKSASRRSSIHPPEYCYLGSGKNELLRKETVILDIGAGHKVPVNYLLVQTEKGFQSVLYFYTANELITNSYYKQQLYFLIKRLAGKNIEGSLIRISKIYSQNNSEEEFLGLQHVAKSVVIEMKIFN